MGQSLSQIYIHLIFGTKNRFNYITPGVEEKLHSYIGGILKNFESPALIINSVPDHIHILYRHSKNHPLTKVVEQVKKTSSKFMKEEGVENFAWQIGYGAFSVSSLVLESTIKYIRNQKQHHKTKTFREEVEDFVREYDLRDYEADFFWS